MKNSIIFGLIIIIAVAIGAYFLLNNDSNTASVETGTESEQTEPTTTTEESAEKPTQTVLGTSVDGNDITAYHYGQGDTEVLFVGGIHGGYSWNTSLVAFELMKYLEDDVSVIPNNVRVTVVPALNPDGLEKVTGTTGVFTSSDVGATETERIAARFNANNVDLNRNFDCEWKKEGVWQSRAVSGGSAPFSEPESIAIRDYITTNTPSAVVVWYSSAGGVYASSCNNGVAAETKTITNLYADASGYPAYQEFDFYEITGDLVNWVAKNNIPGISVLLTNHTSTEWTKNRAGITALLNHYAE